MFPIELWPKNKRKIEDKIKTKANKRDLNKRLEDLIKKENEEKSDDENSEQEVEENVSEEEKVEDIEDVEEVIAFILNSINLLKYELFLKIGNRLYFFVFR